MIDNIYKKPQFVIIRRNGPEFGGSEIEIPADHLRQTLKLHPNWEFVRNIESEVKPVNTLDVETAPSRGEFACPLCPKEFKNDKGLRLHRIKAHA